MAALEFEGAGNKNPPAKLRGVFETEKKKKSKSCVISRVLPLKSGKKFFQEQDRERVIWARDGRFQQEAKTKHWKPLPAPKGEKRQTFARVFPVERSSIRRGSLSESQTTNGVRGKNGALSAK